MKYHFAPLLSAAIVLASVSPVLADGGKSYTLKLHHDAVKGEKSKDHYKIQQSTTQKVLVGGKVAKEETEEIETETSGTRETLAVSPHNKPTEIKFTVDKFLLKTNDESGSKLKAGAVIIAKLGDAKKPTFTVDGEEPEADVAKALALIFELSPDREKEVDDDVVFDTKKPHEVGSTWNANIAEMIASMPEDMPFTLNKDSAKGTVKFPEVTTEGGVECAKVEIEAIMKPKGMKGMPPELKPKRSELKVTEEKLLPLDGKTPALTDTQTMEFNFAGVIATPDGQEATIEVSTEITREGESKQLK